MAEQCSLQPRLITFHTTMPHMCFLALAYCMHAKLLFYLHSKHPLNLKTKANLIPPQTEISTFNGPSEQVSHFFTQGQISFIILYSMQYITLWKKPRTPALLNSLPGHIIPSQ